MIATTYSASWMREPQRETALTYSTVRHRTGGRASPGSSRVALIECPPIAASRPRDIIDGLNHFEVAL